MNRIGRFLTQPITVPWWFIAIICVLASWDHPLGAVLIIIASQFLSREIRTTQRKDTTP